MAVAQSFHQRVRGVEPDEPHLAGPAARLQDAKQREGVRLVRREDAVELERSVRSAEAVEHRLGSFVGAFDVRAAILVRAEHLDVRVLGDLFEEPCLAIFRARRSFGVTQHHDSAALRQHLRKPLGRHAPAQTVVGRDEADVIAALQSRVDDDDWNLRARRVADRTHERRFVERSEDDARYAARDEAFDLGDLRRAIVFAKRSPPDDVDAKLLRRLGRACVNALPEHVRRALRNHGDRQLAAVGRRRRAARGKQDGHQRSNRIVPFLSHEFSLRYCHRYGARQAPQARRVSAHHGVPLRGGPVCSCTRQRVRWCGCNRRPPCTPASQSRRAIDARQSSRRRRRDTDGCRPVSSAPSPLRSRAPTACRTPSGILRARGSLFPIPASRPPRIFGFARWSRTKRCRLNRDTSSAAAARCFG